MLEMKRNVLLKCNKRCFCTFKNNLIGSALVPSTVEGALYDHCYHLFTLIGPQVTVNH
jgi:hypothetical protein